MTRRVFQSFDQLWTSRQERISMSSVSRLNCLLPNHPNLLAILIPPRSLRLYFFSSRLIQSCTLLETSYSCTMPLVLEVVSYVLCRGMECVEQVVLSPRVLRCLEIARKQDLFVNGTNRVLAKIEALQSYQRSRCCYVMLPRAHALKYSGLAYSDSFQFVISDIAAALFK